MAKQQKFKINLSDFDERERAAIGLEIIDAIVKRTTKGIDKAGNRFPGYSQGYKKSLDFKNAGKSSGKVNLKLTGDMLDSLKVLNVYQNGSVEIGFEAGTDDNAKAEGNILGTYGQSDPIPGKARDFLGIRPEELKAITARYKGRQGEKRARDILALEEAAERLGDSIEVEDDE